jgi:short-subunit dehydrogenase
MPTTLRGKKALVVITGASRGIGRELAVQVSNLFNTADTTVFLLARNEAALNEVKQEILTGYV